MKNLFILLMVLFSLETYSKEVRYLVRSPKALLMGDAFTSVANDEYTLFYNPAALGRGSLIGLDFFNPDIGVTNALKDMDKFQNFPSTATGIVDQILNYPIYLHAGATPTLKFGPFGISLFVNATTSFVLKNAIYPQVDIDYRLDRGFVAGYAHTWGSGGKYEKVNPFERKKTKLSTGRATSVGFAIKHINRQGLVGSYSLFGTELLTEINNSETDIDSIRRALGYSVGSAWGGDLGIEHIISTSSSQFVASLSVLDIGGTKFKKEEGTGNIPEQEMVVAAGTSWTQDFTFLDYTLSFDMHPLNQSLDWLRTIHIGAEVGLPLLSIFGGYNGGYLSYGLSVNFWVLKLTAGFYGVELGVDYKEQEGKRAEIYLSLLDVEFSP